MEETGLTQTVTTHRKLTEPEPRTFVGIVALLLGMCKPFYAPAILSFFQRSYPDTMYQWLACERRDGATLERQP